MIRSILIVVALAACANNVGQSSNTGEDGSFGKAKELILANGEITETGIVTYPGGDRFDWKSVELPEKQVGNLDIVLKWKTPRPGLQLAFDVYDQWGHEAIKSKASVRKAKGYRREETVENAKGKYFIRVYAVGRGDAGKYTLTVTFVPPVDVPIFDPLAIELPFPPKLADVPEMVIPCTDDTFEVTKDACKKYCPNNRILAPKDWPPCAGGDANKCMTPDAGNIKCWEDDKIRPQLQCPTPWQKQLARWCKEPTVCPDPPDPNLKACKGSAFVTRILTKGNQGGDIRVVVGGGTDKKITDAWKVRLLRAGTSSTYPGSSCKIVRVDKNKTTIDISGVTLDVVTQNDSVSLEP